MLVDTHAHLFWDSLQEDFDQIIQRSLDAGITAIINVGVDIPLSRKAAEQQNNQLKIYSSIAIHPEEAIKYFNNEGQIQKDIKKLEKIYRDYPQKVIAVGECGLDYGYFTKEGYLPEGLSQEKAKDLQKKLFASQIELAKKLKLPLLIHVRDDRSKDPNLIKAWDEALEMVGDYPTVLHCYSGLMPTTQKALTKTNILISFAGNLTYPKNEYLKESVKVLPLEKIVLETDCPFLPPQSIRGKRNEPSSIKEIAEFIAQVKDISFQVVAEKTTSNIKNFLGI